jgi:branched-chain amino acid transport system ATP-binding protein
MLTVRDLDLYYGDAQALERVSLEVPAGEIVAIVGANGAGKSSLIRSIAGMEKPRAGQVAFKDRRIENLQPHQICDLGIGQVAEGRQVFPTLSVHENLEMGALLPRARARAKQALAEVYAMFPRLAERKGQLAGTLSGGEQQMLALGRCLMGNPELIMFDEPSLGLAPTIVQELFTVFDRLRRHTSIVIVEHNLDLVLALADRVFALERGAVFHAGPAEPLRTDLDYRKRILWL